MKNLIQIHNPKTDLWVKIDCELGKIVGHKKSPGPYKGIPIHEGKKVIQHAEE